jgi:hypothetical protein
VIRPTKSTDVPTRPGVPEVFRRALPLLQTVFAEYEIPEGTALSAEADLTAWFVRFCRRNPDVGPEAQILALLSLACSFSRGYSRTSGEPSPAIAALLAQSPDAVAYRIAATDGVGVLPRHVPRWARLLSFTRKR